MNVLICIGVAIAAYLLGAINPSIILSEKLFHTDIRRFGSKNAGFTNFLRNFGDKAWLVFALDIAKGLIISGLAGLVFKKVFGLFHLGAAYAFLFGAIGHSFPLWYGFRGGKSVALAAGCILLIDWRAALVAYAVIIAMLLITKYMSLSVLCSVTSAVIMLAILDIEHIGVLIFTALSVALIIIRHRENIQRLINHTEPKISSRSRK